MRQQAASSRNIFDQFQEPPPIPLSEPLQRTTPVPPKLMTSAPSRTPSFTSPTLTKRQPPPVPPKKLLKGPYSPPLNPKYSATPSPQLSPTAGGRSVERSPSFGSSTSSIYRPNSSPFEDPMEHPSEMPKIPESRTQSPPPPPPPPPPPSDKVHQETLNRLKDEISTLSKQVESLLSQLEEQNILRGTNEALILENEILKTQVKDTERMMSEVLSANESDSVGSQEQFAHEITRLMGELEEKETQCSDHHRRITALSNEERELREKLRESEGTLAKSITEIAEYRRVVDSKKEEIDDLKGRLSDMTKELSDESGSSRDGSAGMSHRELRVINRDLTNENKGLRGQVRDMERSMEQILLSTRHAKYNEIEGENRKLRMQTRELESMVTQLQSSVSPPSSSRLQQVDNVAKENGKLRSQLQDGKRAYADYRSTSETKIVDLEQKLEALKQENTRLKVDIHAATEGRREEGTVPPPGYDEPFVTPPP